MTKAKTRAQRRGRIRKQGDREANGRLQRESVTETKADAIQARMRQHGLTLAQAGDRLAGYEIGRLYLRGQLDLVDVEVCDSYVEVVARYAMLTNPQYPFPQAMNYVATIKGIGGDPSQDYIDRARKAYASWYAPLAKCDGLSVMAFHNVAFFDHPAQGRLAQVKECLAALRAAFR